MARQPRLVIPGQTHYLVQRGHNAQAVFVDDDDRRLYLRLLLDIVRAQRLPVHAYALLDTEIHLLLMPREADSLGRAMQALGRSYVLAFNRRHGRSGTLWQGRFCAGVLESGECTLDGMRLIDSLAWRRGLASSIDRFHWSSAGHRLGMRRDPLVSDPPEFWGLGNTPFDREVAYRTLLDPGPDEARARQLERTAIGGLALGSEAFLARLAAATGRAVRARPRGRPRSADAWLAGRR
jgi:putative transposase